MTLPAPIIKKSPPRPPLLLFVSCLVLLVGLTGYLGYAALRNSDAFHASARSLQQSWLSRLSQVALPNQMEARDITELDTQSLNQLTGQYRKLHKLFALSVTALGAMVLIAFLIYRYALVFPLRTLTKSCKDVAENNLRGSIWGVERPDLYGELARSISDIRRSVEALADMTVEGPDGTHLVKFSGRSGAVFNTLVGDLHSHIRSLKEDGDSLRKSMENETEAWKRKVQVLEDTIMKNSSNLVDAVEVSRAQLQQMSEDNKSIRTETRDLVDKVRSDLDTIGEITAATGHRVSQTLSTLSASDRDIKGATELTLKSSEAFSKHAADLTEKLVAATTLMRASGKVMMETTEAARTRFLEAVKSLETQDQTLRAFLSNTAEKTEQIAGLYDDLSGSTHRVHDTVERFDARIASTVDSFDSRIGDTVNRFDTRIGDTVDRFDSRMVEFTSKSDAVLEGISISGTAMSTTSARLKETHDTMAHSLESMSGHTDMMARILSTIRDEYSGAMDAWRATMNEATPAIALLKDAGNNIQSQLKEEWTHYSKQSHAILVALEQDARTMNARASQVAVDTDKLMSNINMHSQHLSQSASQFDLQVANLSQRIEAAAGSVMRGNEEVVTNTTAQITEIHEAVADMMQRLGILTQLTGTLGGVAGQLGQLVPALSEMQTLPRGVAGTGVVAPSGSSSKNEVLTARMDQMSTEFNNTLRSMRGEFDTVRTQISKWVDTLSSGYQRLAQQIGNIDGVLETRLAEFRDNMPTASIPSDINVSVDAGDVAAKLAPSLQLIHETLADEATYNMRMNENVEVLRTDLDLLREQVQGSSATLQTMSDLLAQGFTQLLQHEQQMAPASLGIDLGRVETASVALENLIASMQGTSFNLIEKLERVTQELDKAVTKMADHDNDPSGGAERTG
jgi:hypothetical protein